MHSAVLDKTTTTVAAGAVATPIWLPSLAELSSTAAQWLPILGLFWLAIQIVVFLYKSFRGK